MYYIALHRKSAWYGFFLALNVMNSQHAGISELGLGQVIISASYVRKFHPS